MRIAWLSPLPPARTGIAGHSARLLPALAEHPGIEIDVWICRRSAKDVVPLPGFHHVVYEPDSAAGAALAGYDLAVYHVGNHVDHHLEIYDLAILHPGLVVLHDYVLHHFIAARYLTVGGDPLGYVEEMASAYGESGRRLAEETVTEHRTGIWETASVVDFPLNERLLDSARGVIVHSRFAASRLEELRPGVARRSHLCVDFPETVARDTTVRAALDIAEEAFVIGCFGFLSENRSIPTVLDAMASLRDRLPVHLLLVGELSDSSVMPMIDRMGLNERVSCLGFVADDAFARHVQGCDCCVSLRKVGMGEASASLVQMLASGTPCVVSDGDWCSDVPDDAVLRIAAPVDAQGLCAAIFDLASRPGLGQALSDRAIEHVKSHHDWARVAAEYVEIMEEIVG